MSARPKQYNLRSGRAASVQIPVKLQLQSEGVSSTETATSTEAMDECQVSVYDSDECNINFDAFLNTAELDEESCNRSDSCSRIFQNSSVVDSENVEQSSSKEAINQAILTLFASMGK